MRVALTLLIVAFVPASFGVLQREPVARQVPFVSTGKECGSGPSAKIVPDYSTIYYVYNFAAACIRHDQCYSTFGRSQRFCDTEFWRNMRQTCLKTHRPRDPASKRCLAAARLYLRAVTTLGPPFYEAAQREALSGTYRGTLSFRAESGNTFYEDTIAINFTVSGGRIHGDLSASDIELSGRAAVSVPVLSPYGDIKGTVQFSSAAAGNAILVEGTASGTKPDGLTTKATIKAQWVSP